MPRKRNQTPQDLIIAYCVTANFSDIEALLAAGTAVLRARQNLPVPTPVVVTAATRTRSRRPRRPSATPPANAATPLGTPRAKAKRMRRTKAQLAAATRQPLAVNELPPQEEPAGELAEV